MNADRNYRLIKEIEANREFLLMAYRQNPALLQRAEPRIRMLIEGENGHPPPPDSKDQCGT